MLSIIVAVSYLILLIAVMYYDLKHYRIPDWLTFPAMAVFLLFCIVNRADFIDIVLRIAFSGGMFFIVGLITSLWLKKETLGGGDIKLITAIGLYKGWQDTMVLILFSAISAALSVLILVVMKKRKMNDKIPFGFFIALNGIVLGLIDTLNIGYVG